MTVHPKRHIAKTITYRLINSGIGFFSILLLTGSLKIGAGFSVFELLVKPGIYYLHERFWYKYIKYGLEK